MMTGFVQRHVRNALSGRPQTITYDVKGRWDVDGDFGIIIGSTAPVDVAYCLESTDVVFTPPSP
ncbi:hypothetical protein [Rhizobium leguminosarum]|uniref:hypothetical protein n=1 Tax=Rhizobium leguminosarum TaxID=384 RepID=UPI001C9372F1|nr:hypothetical protein [Rhizobium leguminosarum]MBY5318215.1 hypothetical protein [Rhizobium leguminosarum]